MTYKRRKQYGYNPRIRQYDNPKEWKKLKYQVYRRDKFKCQFPGCKCRTKLECHHILPWSKYPALRYNIFNLITLCKEHHMYITGNEEVYASVLQKIIFDNANSKKK